jgi:translocation and assembly module TamB
MLRRYSTTFLTSLLLGLVMLINPAHGEMPISASTSLDTFTYDLDNIHLKLEKLNADWQFSPMGDSRLWVDHLRAKRLIITIGNGKPTAPDSGLPERIQVPFPIKIMDAEIAELVVLNNGETQTFSQVKLDVEADTKIIKINHLKAMTPWGETTSVLEMQAKKPFALSGEVSLKGTKTNTAVADASKIQFDTKLVLSGNLETVRFQSNLQLARINQDWVISSSESANTPNVAQINLDGQLALSGHQALNAKLDMVGFNPANFGPYPDARLNIDVAIQAALSPNLETTITFVSRDSQWQANELTSKGKIVMTGNQLRDLALEAKIAHNTFKANGALGLGNKLIWQANLADLAELHPDYVGQAELSGVIEQAENTGQSAEANAQNLAAQISLLATNIAQKGGFSVARVAGQASIMADATGAVQGELTASKLQYGERSIQTAKLSLHGTRANHALNISAQGSDFNLTSQLQGGLTTDSADWQGAIQTLVLTGKTPFKLSAPARLTFSAQTVDLTDAQLQLTNGQLQINRFKIDANGVSSTGKASHLNLADLPADVAIFPVNLTGEPVLSGKWDIRAEHSLNGYINVWRESGDLEMIAADGSKKALGLSDAKFDLNIVNNTVEMSSQIKGTLLGSLEAKLMTKLTKTATGFALLGDAPLTLTGQATLQTLAWLPLPSSFKDANFDGALRVQVNANGTISEPNLTGHAQGEHLQLSLASEGVSLVNGTLQAVFEQKQLRIQQATWQGGDGTINTSGAFLFDQANPSIHLDWVADNFTAISRADRLLILNGKGKTTLVKDQLMIEGDFTVAKGLIELADDDKPTLGADVVVLGQTNTTAEPTLKVLLNRLRIDVGKDFTLRGRGLDAELTGAVTLTGLTVYRPYTEGIIQVRKGSFNAYGQTLNIERGILNFNGTFDNPAINIRAMRNNKAVNAGIEITGTAFIPITKLVSEPEVAESEKLAWLVLGHGMDQTNKNDYGLLSLAAGVLLSQGQSVPLQTQLAHAAGLDELNFAGGDADSAAVVFGKRITSNMYLSYQKSVSGLLDVARLTYNITSRWSLRGEAGTESAVDVLYTFSFK